MSGDTKEYMTEEEVREIEDLICLNDGYLYAHGFREYPHHKAIGLVNKMWAEIQDLRSTVRKQIY